MRHTEKTSNSNKEGIPEQKQVVALVIREAELR